MGTKKKKEVLQCIVLRKTREERKLATGAIRSNAFRSFLQLLFGAPGSDILKMRIRRICCLTNLGTTPLVSSETVMERE